jgi:hypothetical protein
MLVALLAMGGSASSACGNLTVGGFGEVTVAVSGDAPDSAPTAPVRPQTTILESPASRSGSSEESELEGRVELEFEIFLVLESGGTLRLGDDEFRVSVDLRGRTEVKAVEGQLVPATRYTGLQVVFKEIRAEVEGLVVGGVPIREVRVEIDDTALLVTRSLELMVVEGQTVELLADLNSLAWLAAVDPLTATVDEAVFAALFDVVVR